MVSGFDGERTLSADRGWTIRNRLSWTLPFPSQELYIAADYSEIGGRGADLNLGTHLTGGATGLCGAINPANLSYDFSGGHTIL